MQASEKNVPEKDVPETKNALAGTRKTVAYYCLAGTVFCLRGNENLRARLLNRKFIEICDYIFWGAMTTIVSFASYGFFTRACGFSVEISTVFSWICAVSFAFFTNKLWVFGSRQMRVPVVAKEFFSFVNSRLASGFMELAIMWLFVEILGFNDWLIKIIASVLVVVANYIFSIVFVFNKK